LALTTTTPQSRFAELQQRWHGSPVGAGIALLSMGGFLVLLAAAWSRIS
jgi:hypothetical protein